MAEFHIQRCLGRGGFGEVYKGVMSRGGGVEVDVAVKVLRADLEPESQGVQRLRDEGRLLGRLTHPTILRVYDLVVIRGRAALVSEYVDGDDLGRLLREDRIPPRAVFEVVAQVAAALDAAWSWPSVADGKPLHLVHRDIKPDNIRVDPHGVVKLLDFGIAQAQTVLREAQTSVNTIMGSTQYLAPERLVQQEVGPEADVFALGCTLFEALTGQALFARRSMRQMYLLMVDERRFDQFIAERASSHRERLGGERAVALFRAMTAWRKQNRPSAAEVAARCDAISDSIDGQTLTQWCRARSWDEPVGVEGPLDGFRFTVAQDAGNPDPPREDARPERPALPRLSDESVANLVGNRAPVLGEAGATRSTIAIRARSMAAAEGPVPWSPAEFAAMMAPEPEPGVRIPQLVNQRVGTPVPASATATATATATAAAAQRYDAEREDDDLAPTEVVILPKDMRLPVAPGEPEPPVAIAAPETAAPEPAAEPSAPAADPPIEDAASSAASAAPPEAPEAPGPAPEPEPEPEPAPEPAPALAATEPAQLQPPMTPAEPRTGPTIGPALDGGSSDADELPVNGGGRPEPIAPRSVEALLADTVLADTLLADALRADNLRLEALRRAALARAAEVAKAAADAPDAGPPVDDDPVDVAVIDPTFDLGRVASAAPNATPEPPIVRPHAPLPQPVTDFDEDEPSTVRILRSSPPALDLPDGAGLEVHAPPFDAPTPSSLAAEPSRRSIPPPDALAAGPRPELARDRSALEPATQPMDGAADPDGPEWLKPTPLPPQGTGAIAVASLEAEASNRRRATHPPPVDDAPSAGEGEEIPTEVTWSPLSSPVSQQPLDPSLAPLPVSTKAETPQGTQVPSHSRSASTGSASTGSPSTGSSRSIPPASPSGAITVDASGAPSAAAPGPSTPAQAPSQAQALAPSEPGDPTPAAPVVAAAAAAPARTPSRPASRAKTPVGAGRSTPRPAARRTHIPREVIASVSGLVGLLVGGMGLMFLVVVVWLVKG